MFENVTSQITPELMKWLEEDRKKRADRLQRMITFMRETLILRYPTLAVDEYNAKRLLDIADFVEPCNRCDKKVCNRSVCKLVTIDEITLYKGEIGSRYHPNCRKLNYYVTFGMLVNTIRNEPDELF